jgi:hypothetical protein
LNSNLILKEEVNCKGAMSPLRILKPSEVVSGNTILGNIEKRKERGKWIENQQTRRIAASRRE